MKKIMEQKYNIIQVIGMLKTHPKLEFQRVNDLKFVIYKGNFGDLMFRIESKSEEFKRQGVLKIFNYLQDLWIIKG